MSPPGANNVATKIAHHSKRVAFAAASLFKWTTLVGIGALLSLLGLWKEAPHVWQSKIFRVYHGDSDDIEARLSSTAPVLFALKSAYPGEVPIGTSLGAECRWSIDQPSSPLAPAFVITGRECNVDSQRISENVRSYADQAHLEIGKPFRLTIKAIDQGGRPILSGRDSSGSRDIPSVIITFEPAPNAQQETTLPSGATHPETSPDNGASVAARSEAPHPVTRTAPLTTLIEGFFNDSIKSDQALRQLGRVQLVLPTPPSAYLLGVGVARCKVHADVRGPDGTSLIDEDFPGNSHSSEPIEDADLIATACNDAVRKIVARLSG